MLLQGREGAQGNIEEVKEAESAEATMSISEIPHPGESACDISMLLFLLLHHSGFSSVDVGTYHGQNEHILLRTTKRLNIHSETI